MAASTPSPLNPAYRFAQPQPVALFISDLHLHPGMPATTQAFFDFLRDQASKARQLYLLGDIFEYWAGDDDLDSPFNRRIAAAIRETGDAGVEVFWMPGNRDFLVGDAFAEASCAALLPDPFLARIDNRTVLLSHGDAQCTDDHAYMAFRQQVRSAAWRDEFLAQPLEQRKKIIEGLRQGSRDAQRAKPPEIMDVNPGAIDALFDAGGASVMIHGHTHRPALHESPGPAGNRLRYVLPDWDLDAEPRRGGWIALESDAAIRRYDQNGQCLS